MRLCYKCRFSKINVNNSLGIVCLNSKANIIGSTAKGIKNWSDWPWDFHAMWVLQCDGFQALEKSQDP